MCKADIGMIGLAVMGENLALNLESRGFSVAVYNRERDWIDRFLNGRGTGKNFIACPDLKTLVQNLQPPRKIMMMVRAGAAVDELIEALLPLMEEGDIIIDGGNSRFQDTMRRTKYVEEQGMLFIGTGVSGGEEGALKGPSLMPGGSAAAWPHVRHILQAICARADGMPCCEWVGENGAGHFVKMVHNGIEYGDMQLICEAYHLMRDYLRMDTDEMAAVFREWNQTELHSYLIEITGEILARREADGTPTVNLILDAAGQKGTGKWTGITALDQGVPLTLIGEAVFARCLSARKEDRMQAAQLFPGDIPAFAGDRVAFLQDLRQALYASKIISYAQGYELMRSAAEQYGWKLNYSGIARIWRGGCIIRSVFLGEIARAFEENPELNNLVMDARFAEIIRSCLPAWRRICASAQLAGIPAPAFCSALNYFDGYSCPSLPANLLQAQRDYFGAHTYERMDRPRGEYFHTDWTGIGGRVQAETYNA